MFKVDDYVALSRRYAATYNTGYNDDAWIIAEIDTNYYNGVDHTLYSAFPSRCPGEDELRIFEQYDLSPLIYV
jgi:hypothetical protein